VTGSLHTEPLCELIDGGGLLVAPESSSGHVQAIDRDEIICLFERHGVMLLRGFDLDTDDLVPFTDRFTQSYTTDAIRRRRRFGHRQIGDVDPGDGEIGLHSEAAFSPVWPEIIWFYCRAPSTAGAFTTICDGVALWRGLSPDTQARFLAQPVKYRYPSQLGHRSPGRGVQPWPFQAVGTAGLWDRDQGIADLSVVRFAVAESRAGQLCFANHVFMTIEGLVATMADGSPIPGPVVAEIQQAAAELTCDIRWQARDLLMLDNWRFTHGRRAFDAAGDPRDIVQVQTERASFAYGATLRRAIAERRP
jgi:alpha-ketoglutarate-dependent taurine dioxygenase